MWCDLAIGIVLSLPFLGLFVLLSRFDNYNGLY